MRGFVSCGLIMVESGLEASKICGFGESIV
jgi:hypothetical protein